jgi:GNAT superfamily N-acetyltransferase
MNESVLLRNGETVVVGIFRPDDAEGIGRLFRAVYGEGYPVRIVYNPEELRAAFDRRESMAVVARRMDGEVVGAVSLFRSTPSSRLYESGQGLVLPAWRGLGINGFILRHLLEVVAPSLGIDAVFGESVCNHPYMQRTTANLGYVETGLEVDLMPHEAYSKEGRPGRVSVLPQFRLYGAGADRAHVPAAYAREFGFLYQSLNVKRTVLPCHAGVAATGQSEITSQIFEFARVARVAVSRAGADFEGAFAEKEEECLFNGTLVLQVWLSLADPAVGAATEHLRGLGYFFGGLLLCWFGHDALLMQKIVMRPNWEAITLYTDRAKRILEMVHGDWERTKA